MWYNNIPYLGNEYVNKMRSLYHRYANAIRSLVKGNYTASRRSAVLYAIDNAYNTNSYDGYYYFAGGDCTNFVSHCLVQGLEMDDNWYFHSVWSFTD